MSDIIRKCAIQPNLYGLVWKGGASICGDGNICTDITSQKLEAISRELAENFFLSDTYSCDSTNELITMLISEIEFAVQVSAYRWFPSLDVATPDRNQRAWSLREGVMQSLFPTTAYGDVVEARDHRVDFHGRTLQDSQTLISFLFNKLWEILNEVNPNEVTREQFIQTNGNYLFARYAVPMFGKFLYQFNEVVEYVTGMLPANRHRFDDGLLTVPEHCQVAEHEYQKQVRAIALAHAKRELEVANQRAATAKSSLALVTKIAIKSKVGSTVAGTLVNAVVGKSQRVRQAEAHLAELAYRESSRV